MKIANHCKPGSWRNKDGWTPQMPWEDDCYVQWGGHGLVASTTKAENSYTTAFFEAFPKNPNTFIRGEGLDIASAELDAWEKYQRLKECDKHDFRRGRHRNGGGTCSKCGMFSGQVFEPLDTCVICGAPTFYTSDKYRRWYCEEHADMIPENAKHGFLKSLLGED